MSVPAAPKERDLHFMKLARRWARKGRGSTYPNPSVGAVIVRGETLLGQAHSGPTGSAHAEVQALAQASEQSQGATMYVTLEPCAHHGRTPPCVEAIIRANVARVVYGIEDPDPQVRGKGLAALRSAGIEVQQCQAKAARRLHAHYLWHVATQRPFVSLKAAISLDGQIACASGHSQWITSSASRRRGHKLRARHHAILVGRGTAEHDDPALTVRHVEGSDPIVVLLDSQLSLAQRPLKIYRPGTLVYCLPDPDPARVATLTEQGVQVRPLDTMADGGLDLEALLVDLGEQKIRSLLVEGGAQVLGSFLRTGLWNAAHLFVAPRFLGQGKAMLGAWSAPVVEQGPAVQVRKVRRVGPDLEIRLRPVTTGRASSQRLA